MKLYIRSSSVIDDVLEVAKTTKDMKELGDIIESKDNYNYLSSIGEQVSKNPNLTADFIEKVISSPRYAYQRVRSKIMDSPLISEDILKSMAYSKDVHMRLDAASSPYLSVELMRHLSKDQDSSVRNTLAKNPRFPESLMKALYAKYKGSGYYLALNPNTPLDLLEEILNDKYDSDTTKAAKQAIKQRTGKDTSKSIRKSPWMSLMNKLQSELEEGIDPLYEQTSVGEELDTVCRSVEDKLGVYLEPSIQGGFGGIWIYSKEDDSTLVENYDYQDYNDEVINIALNSKTKREFQTNYKQFLQSIIA